MEATAAIGSDDDLKGVDEFVRFVFFPVGHGSCTLVSLPPEEPGGDRIYGVIDCKDSTARPIRAYLSEPWFEQEPAPKAPLFTLRFVVLTHYHLDHFLGLDHLLGQDGSFRYQHFLCPFPPAGVVAQRKERNPLIQNRLNNIQRLAPKCEFLKINTSCDGVYRPRQHLFDMRAIAPPNSAIARMREWTSLDDVTPANILSSAIRFQWGDCSAVIAGDVEEEEWEEILSDFESKQLRLLMSVNVALSSHHGGDGNPDRLWQRISRCSDLHKQARETDLRASPTLAVISCGSSRTGSPSSDSLQTIFRANSLVRCTSLPRVCFDRYAGAQPASPRRIGRPLELPPGAEPRRTQRPDLPPSFINHPKDFKAGSVCADLFPKRPPRFCYHNGTQAEPITKGCSCHRA